MLESSFSVNFDAKSDEEIVGLVFEDQDLFLHIVKRYKIKLYNYIKRISNASHEEAEDILQTVFLNTFKNLNDFDGSLKFSSWIYRIAHNAVIDNFRKKSVRPQSADIEIESDRIMNMAYDFDITREIDRDILKKSLMSALDKLGGNDKEIIILKYFEEKNYQEISDIIKKPIGTVASRLNKAKDRLKKVLEDEKLYVIG
jgi:RNA polymerase sigma-70 factor (ECF subfamily)